MLKRTTPLAILLLLLALTSTSACRNKPAQDNGLITTDIRPSWAKVEVDAKGTPLFATDEGSYASFLYVDADGVCAIHIGAMGESSLQGSIFLVAPDCPASGQFNAAKDGELAKMNEVYGTLQWNPAQGPPQHFQIDGGNLEISDRKDTQLEGRINVQLHAPGVDTAEHTLKGSFRARRTPTFDTL